MHDTHTNTLKRKEIREQVYKKWKYKRRSSRITITSIF